MIKIKTKDRFEYDYESIGLNAGLEVHAQLESERKLFCHCKPDLLPPNAYPDYHFERRFRPVLGEMGTFDAGMLVEFEKSYQVVYQTFSEDFQSLCTYEMDETPPFYPDFETIKKGYIIGNFFNCISVVDEVIFNRKQYLDGSIPTGFQRTAIIARDGYVKLKNNKTIRINNILIEEDAARRVNFIERSDRVVYFNLDRLGIPLTEIITNHTDCHHPNDLMEVGLLIGLSLRVLGVGKRGIGTIRQDVNISISNGSRVELKGIQNIKDMKKYVDHEIMRQLVLIDIKEILIKRGLTSKEFLPNYIDVSSAANLNAELSEVAFAVRLPKCSGIFQKEVQPHKNFDEEIFDRIELITGISMTNMTHSDFPSNWLDAGRVSSVLNLSDNDAFVVIKGKQKSVLHALNRLIERMKHITIGVPQETRRVNPNTYNSEFLRVIHGRDRMYSDTDTPPISIDESVRNLNEDNIEKPWDLFSYQEIDIFQLKFLIENGFYTHFCNLNCEFPDKTSKIIGLFQKCFYLMEKNSIDEKSIYNYIEIVLKDILNNNISVDYLENILKDINSNRDYSRDKYCLNIYKIPNEHIKRINIILSELNEPIKDISIKKMFAIVKTHFPMFTSEQIIYILRNLKFV